MMENISSYEDSPPLTHRKTHHPLNEVGEISFYKCLTTKEIRKVVQQIFENNSDILPKSKEALIFLKPNLNSDMCGLTGNTTDLRILSAVMAFMKNNGYSNVVVGDGTSTGFINTGINVISRLKIDRIAQEFGFNVIDLNKAASETLRLDSETDVEIARICFDSELFINLPKIKTHAEARVSVCLKNMIGCVVGTHKQKIHRNLHENIIRLNCLLQPDIHIVDGLIAMEGTGPSRGKPVKMGLIISGRNPWLIDRVCTILMGFNPEEVPHLRTSKGLKNIAELQINSSSDLNGLSWRFQSPEISLGSLINSPTYRKFFVKLRYHPALFRFFSSNLVSRFLYLIKARQDLFIKQDSSISKVLLDKSKCVNCHLCLDYCPMYVDSYDEIGEPKKCLFCLYCFFVCPENAISLEGPVGYLKYQLTNYAGLIRNQVSKQTYSEDDD